MFTRPALALLAAAGLVLASPALARQQESSSETRMINVDGKTKTEVVIKNGKVTATVNGKDVPADRIQMDKDRVRILDADGNVIADFNNAQEANTRTQEAGTRAGQARQRGQDAEQRALESEQRALQSAQRALFNLDRIRGTFAGRESVIDAPPKVMMGVTLSSPDEALAEHFGLDEDKVTMIAGITKGLPAQKAGLKRFDLVTQIEGNQPAGQNDLRKALRAKNPGDEISLTIISKGDTKTVTLKLEAFDAEKLDSERADGEPGDGAVNLGGEEMSRRFSDAFGTGGAWSGNAPEGPNDSNKFKGFRVPPAPPNAPSPPGVFLMDDRSRDLERRLDRLEEQLNRLGELLEKNAAQKTDSDKKDGGR